MSWKLECVCKWQCSFKNYFNPVLLTYAMLPLAVNTVRISFWANRTGQTTESDTLSRMSWSITIKRQDALIFWQIMTGKFQTGAGKLQSVTTRVRLVVNFQLGCTKIAWFYQTKWISFYKFVHSQNFVNWPSVGH